MSVVSQSPTWRGRVVAGLLLVTVIVFIWRVADPRRGSGQVPGATLRISVSNPDGILLIYDANIGDPEEPIVTSIAYWHYFADGETYVYGRGFIALVDLGLALRNLRRDVGYNAYSLAMIDPITTTAWNASARQPVDSTTWELATLEGIATLMGDPQPAQQGPFVPVIG